MKPFFVSVLLAIVLLSGFSFEGPSRERIQQQTNMADFPVRDHFSYSSGISGVLNIANTEENNRGFIQHLLPSFQRFPYCARLAGKVAELIRNHEISGYIYIARYHVTRLEGPGIIHPFNYFW